MSTARAAGLAGLALVLLIAAPAGAHDDAHKLSGSKLKMSDPAGRIEKRKFIFKAKRQLQIYDVSEDLTELGANLRVAGPGAADGRSGMIYLAPGAWKRLGKADSPKGWKYKAEYRYPYSEGVSTVIVKKSSSGGSLLVKAKGQHWPYYILGPQQGVEISLTLGGERYCASFSEFKKNEAGKVMAKGAPAPSECSSVCGNGEIELGEQCDDANDSDDDNCSATCQGCMPADIEYQSTFAALQELIFDSEQYQCSNEVCHGSSQAGGLDLRAGASHAALVNVASTINPNVVRVFPGDQDLSMLYLKVAAKTLGTAGVPGSPMPSAATTVSESLLGALKLWIQGGASAGGVVAGSSELLEACLPEPGPNKIPRPEAPAAGSGVQFAMPGYHLGAQTERELCMSTYYDLTAPGLVPDEYRVPCPGVFGANDTDECFAYSTTLLAQDPQSHHNIVLIYRGDYGVDDPGWGQWRCYLGANDGEPCDPRQVYETGTDPCPDGVCGGDDVEGVGCLPSLGDPYGPPDFGFINLDSPQVAGAQQATQLLELPDGVYWTLPMQGIIVWNSHAFNLTSQDTRLEGWANLDFTSDLSYPAQLLAYIKYIWTQDVPPFEQREYCATYTMPSDMNVFWLSSHTHKRGVRWRYYAPPQQPCGDGPAPPVPFSTGTDPDCLPGQTGDIFYESHTYSDPVELRYDPPWNLSGSVSERTVKYCALYDNGMNDPSTVKRRSTSPMPYPTFLPGGPCAPEDTYCIGGPNQGQLCQNSDGNCPGGECDACPSRGGVRTDDEMFVPILYYYSD